MKLNWSMRVWMVPFLFAVFGSSPAEARSYGGSATGAKVTVPATGTVVRAATGTVPIGGGGTDAAILVGDIPGSATGGVVSLSTGVMRSAIIGTDATRAEASMGNVTLTVSGNQITADFVMARGAANCGPAVSGSSEVSSLVINSQQIAVTGNPNQTLTLSNGTVVINEQTSSVSGTTAHITVNALHVTTTDAITHQQLADVVLGDIDPQVDCSGGPPPNTTFGTGGGWIDGNIPTDGRANFGVVGGIQPDGGFRGHVLIDDRSVNFKMQSTSIDNVIPSGCQTIIDGTGQSNGSPVQFRVTIVDVADPGADQDTFSIEVPPGTPVVYGNADTFLNGGNIQGHPCP